MKTTKLTLCLLFTGIFFCSAGDFKPQFGLSLKGSTYGLGADVYFRPFKVLAIKAGYEGLATQLTADMVQPIAGDAVSVKIPMPSGSDMIFNPEARYNTGSLSVQLGFQPIGLFYLTAGVGTFNLDMQVLGVPATDLSFGSQEVPNVGTVTPIIKKEDLGNFKIQFNPSKKLAPYFGIGLGSFVPRNKRISFALELGAYYMGSPKLTATLPEGLKSENIDYGAEITESQKQEYFGSIESEIDGFINDMQNEINTNVNDINTQIEPFKIYPVLKLTIGIKVL